MKNYVLQMKMRADNMGYDIPLLNRQDPAEIMNAQLRIRYTPEGTADDGKYYEYLHNPEADIFKSFINLK